MKTTVFTLGICFLSFLSTATVAQTSQPVQSPASVESRELNSRAVKLYDEGNYDEALPLAKRALELSEKALGAEHQDLLPLLLNLGELYRVKKKWGDAEACFDRALKITEKTVGPEDPRITRTLDKLAYITYERRDDKKAENLFARSLAIKEKAFGTVSPQLLPTALNLAHLYRLKGDHRRAETLYQQVIRIHEQTGAKDTRGLSDALEGYATLLFVTNRVDDGVAIQKRLAAISVDPGIVQGGVLNGRALHLERPPYPANAGSEGGTVFVQVLIDERGKVISATANNTARVHQALVSEAENAARRSRFTPTLLSGVPVKVRGMIVYRFERRTR